nr:hypothetical protein [Leucobacter edaphi]
MLGGSFRGSASRGARSALVFVVLAAVAVAVAAAPAMLIADGRALALVDVIVGSLILIAVCVVPFFENRRMLEPRQFAQYPTTPGAIGLSMLVTSFLTWPFFLLVLWLTVLGLTRTKWNGPVWVAALALVLAAVFALCAVRVTSGLAQLLVGDRYAGIVRTLGVVLLVAFVPVAVFAVTSAFTPAGLKAATDAAGVLSWTPFGAPFAAPDLAAQGDTAGAAMRLGVIALCAILFAALWLVLARAIATRVDYPRDQNIARTGLGWFERFPARPSQVIAARELTYWARDPRYKVALWAIPIAPILMLVAFWVAGVEPRMLALVPLPVILLLLGWSLHNDVAMDSTAIWTHVASGTRGSADRAGRLAPVLMIGVPLALIGSSITVTLLGDWRVLPAVIGLNVGVLLVSCGVSSVFSVLMPYPATRPGDSPFVQPQWSGSGSGMAQTLSMVVAILLSIPATWVAVSAIHDVTLTENLLALLVGLGSGVLVLVLGIFIGGKIFDRSGPELIAVTQVFD